MGRALDTVPGSLYNMMIIDTALGLILFPFRFRDAAGDS